CQHYYSSPCRF
nr:immunoglobulin light chain junction region [Macaca mulatta]